MALRWIEYLEYLLGGQGCAALVLVQGVLEVLLGLIVLLENVLQVLKHQRQRRGLRLCGEAQCRLCAFGGRKVERISREQLKQKRAREDYEPRPLADRLGVKRIEGRPCVPLAAAASQRMRQ